MRQDVKQNEMTALGNKQSETMTAAQQRLVTDHIAFAYKLAWRLREGGLPLEDLRQEGLMGLCEAAMHYEEQEGVSFRSYAYHYCRKRMLMAIYHYGSPVRLSHTCRFAFRFLSLDEPDMNPDEENESKADRLMMPASLEQEEEQERWEDLRNALTRLPERERAIITMIYGLEEEALSITDAAEKCGVSIPRMSVLHKRALQHLRQLI